MKSRPIPGFVDGPDPDKEDLDRAESAIAVATTLAIALGSAIACIVFVTAACFALRRKGKGQSSGDAPPVQSSPTMLTSGGVTEKDMKMTTV